jgi:UDP-N-acetylglucosamine 2-epimerase (non-hydrolysing)
VNYDMRIAVVLGTRPEIIKFSPIIRRCEALKLDYSILHTGQHYSYNMDKVFFEQLGLRGAEYNFEVGSETHGRQIGRMIVGLESILQKERPDIVLVEGDTNTVLAGAVAATKLGLGLGHVEAGLRSHDRFMPEETNRVVADHCANLLFAPTETSRDTLLGEGITEDRVFLTGNTIVDAVQQNLKIATKAKKNVLDEFRVAPDGYCLTTIHRQENVDDALRFSGILRGLELIHKSFKLPIIYPIHPRSKKQMEHFKIASSGVQLTEPLDYLSFLQLEKDAKLVLTDSGGVQEEACILGVPCVTLRDNTERPETLDVGSNILAGADPHKIAESAKLMLERPRSWKNPFGDGKAAERIVQIVVERYK